MYIKYIQIFRKLERCYDSMVHPQKRRDVKKLLELVIVRVIELKHELIQCNPRVKKFPEYPQAREYIHLVDILVDLKLSTSVVDIPIPRYFTEDNQRLLEGRNELIAGYMMAYFNTKTIHLPTPSNLAQESVVLSVDQAIEIIQKYERGRQGILRALKFKEIRDSEKRTSIPFDADRPEKEIPDDLAATSIQRFSRGVNSRKAALIERENELKFLGMTYREDGVELLREAAAVDYRKNKQEQAENKAQYERGLREVREVMVEEEGPDIKERLREERTFWITDQIAQGRFPSSLNDFGKPVQIEADTKAEEKESKTGKDKKGAKDDKKKAAKAEVAVAEPKEEGSQLLSDMHKMVSMFEEVWQDRDESDNFHQSHDLALVKDEIMPNVMDELREQVDALLTANLEKIARQLNPKFKAEKKKDKKGKGKKSKGKKGKEKTVKLPGDKIPEVKEMDLHQMLSILINHELLVFPRNIKLPSLIGDINFIDKPEDPSIAQIRQNLTEYCILPNGSDDIKSRLQTNVRSVMLYGPAGAGKTHAVEAVANELGAMLIHIDPEKINKLRNVFPGKQGATKLVHMIFMVARHPVYQPGTLPMQYLIMRLFTVVQLLYTSISAMNSSARRAKTRRVQSD